MDNKIHIQPNPYGYWDFYKRARDKFLKEKIPNYPNERFSQFLLSFDIPKSTSKAPLIYAILERIKSAIINQSAVSIAIDSEEEFLSSYMYICDLVHTIWTWKSTVLYYNNVLLNPVDEFEFLKDHLKEKYHNILDKNCFPIEYLPKKKREKKVVQITQVLISKNDLHAALNTVIDKYIELYGNNKDVKVLSVSSNDKVVIIENDFIINFRIVPCYWARREEERDWEYPYIMIQELTHNGLFKYNNSDFARRFQYENIGIDFYFFHGLHYYRKEIDHFDAVDKALPELNLQKRIADYPGEIHHFILLRMIDSEGKTFYGIGNTKGSVHSFVLRLCNELETKDSWSLFHNGTSCLSFSFAENKDFAIAFLSWKGKKKRWRLETHFSYFYEDKAIKDERDIRKTCNSILKAAKKGKYNSVEFGFYSKPLNRWKSEELVYNITKKLYSDYQVIFQYKPPFLTTESGNMSYDIYICGLKTAIEYQGKQHFEPVEYFGGIENFQQQQERDKLKALLSKENNVKLVYINYWESITPELVRQRVEE